MKFNSENIVIEFLDEQLIELQTNRNKKVESGKLGGQASVKQRLSNAKATVKHKDKEEDIYKDKELKNVFNLFRVKYKGTKKGLDTEFKTIKKHKDWKNVIPILDEAVNNYITDVESQRKNEFPLLKYKNLSTWINQREWEKEYVAEPKYNADGVNPKTGMRTGGDPFSKDLSNFRP